jgi:predicted RNase H-like HicB family nuclease
VSCPRHGIERCPRGSQDKSPKSRVGGEYGQLQLSYTGLIDGKAGAYGVVFPNLPGCVAIGATIVEAVRNAADAMRDWADVTVETGGAMPEPRPSEMLLTDPEIADEIGRGALLRSVPLARSSGRRAKANLSIDAAYSRRSTRKRNDAS